jgi:hypothetical protein
MQSEYCNTPGCGIVLEEWEVGGICEGCVTNEEEVEREQHQKAAADALQQDPRNEEPPRPSTHADDW